MLNTSVSLGRANIPVTFISEFATDNIGNIISRFLNKNKVITKHIYRYKGLSPLALAFINEQKDAAYDFYEIFPKKRLDIDVSKLNIMPDDILLFGSIMAVTKNCREKLEEILSVADKAGSIVLYDPNIRDFQIPIIEELKPLILQNIAYSDIVRASDEDMNKIAGCSNSKDAYELVNNNGCEHLIYTAGSEGVYLETPALSKYYSTHVVETISTIGAGDSFNAGIAYMFHRKNIRTLRDISEDTWDTIIGKAMDFASNVCMSEDNYISVDFASGLKEI